ncbi:MAG: VOC family protein, partial [Proteobacteria bacterium]|nr:VOC family protein [Pseudomonadota bacterium]
MAPNTGNTDYGIDHLMLGASDLSLGKTWIENQFELPAMDGGRHPGQGTRNALLGLAEDCYLEVIAPDPAQVLAGTLGAQLLRYKTPRLRTFAVRCSSFEDLVPRLAGFGFGHRILEMSRETVGGGELSWRLLFVSDHPYGCRMPFFIDWG